MTDVCLRLAFMPVADSDRKPLYHEGLARVEYQQRFLVPIQFLPSLQDNRLMAAFDGHVLALAVEWLKANPTLNLALNIMPETIGDADWLAAFDQLVTPDLRPRLILELSDVLLVSQWLPHANSLALLRASGVRLAFDNLNFRDDELAADIDRILAQLFGVGVDFAKLDQVFVDRLCQSTYGSGTFNAFNLIRQYAEDNQVGLVAGGIEYTSQIDFLDALGVNHLQGFLIGKPELRLDNQAGESPFRLLNDGVGQLIAEKAEALAAAAVKKK
jgi:EAL domain-containing protein (putative c-di-GMP-specific phosphodiesterase class I)